MVVMVERTLRHNTTSHMLSHVELGHHRLRAADTHHTAATTVHRLPTNAHAMTITSGSTDIIPAVSGTAEAVG